MLKLEAYRPTLQAAAPLYSSKQATRHWAASPVSLRPEWPEYPCPRFLLTLGLIVGSLLLSLVGVTLKAQHDTPVLEAEATESHSAHAADLVGLNGTEVKERFGAPALVRHEPPAEIWQYRNADCVLDLFVYADTPPAKVQHAEIRARHASAETETFESSCLHDLTMATAH